MCFLELFLICLLTVDERGRVFLFQDILENSGLVQAWLPLAEALMLCSVLQFPSPLFLKGVGAGHCPEKDLGSCPAPRFLHTISHRPSAPSTCLGQLQVDSCEFQTPLACKQQTLPFPLFTSQCSCNLSPGGIRSCPFHIYRAQPLCSNC